MPRILIVASNPPGSAHVGEILLSDMLSVIEPQDVHVVVVSPGPPPPEASVGVRSLEWIQAPGNPSRGSFPGRIGGGVAMVDRRVRIDRLVNKASNDLADQVARIKPDVVWGILSSTALVDVLWAFRKRVDVACFCVQVWDDARYLAQGVGLDARGVNRTLERAGDLMARANRVAVIGEAMAEEYQRLFGVESSIIRQGLTEHVAPLKWSLGHDLVIGFSGAMYARSAFNALIAALSLLEWRIGDRAVRLQVMGSVVQFELRGPARIELTGNLAPAIVLERNRACDLLYLPQAFEPELRLFTQLSFPTKLSTYVASGRPVLVHSPLYGAVHRFCAEHPVGGLVDSLEAEQIASELRRILTDRDVYEAAAADSARVGSGKLGRAQFEASVRNMVCS